MNTRFGRAFRYEVQNYFRAVAVLWLVMALLPAAMLAIAYFLAGETAVESSFNGYSSAVGMFGLILGMVGLRENQRVLNQNGVSRRSAFLADVAALHIGDFRPDGFTWTLDVLFDNIFFDWSVLEQISNSRDRVEDLRRQVGRTQGQLNLEFNQVCRERDAVCRELDHLVETA